MSEDSSSVCSSCGAKLLAVEDGRGLGICASCATHAPQDAGPTLHVTAETHSLHPTSAPSDRQPREPLEVAEQFGRFEIQERLGRGGFGTVYRAYDPLLDREVALKVPRLVDRESQHELFLHEAKSAARLRHPNIVAVFECGIVGDDPFIASEFVEGV